MDVINMKRSLLKFGFFRLITDFIRPVSIKGKNNKVICACKTSKRLDFHISISGNNNVVKIASTCQLYNTVIYIIGDNNVLVLDDEVKIQKGFFYITGGTKFIVKHNTTFQEVNAFVTKGDVTIGADCLFSYGILIRNYDGHKIVDTITGTICNPPGKIVIENHVWVSQNVTILKDVVIGSNSIIGVGAIVTRSLPRNSIAAGVPARVVKENRNWIRH